MKSILPLFIIFLFLGCSPDFPDRGGLHSTVDVTVIDEFSGKALPNMRLRFSDCSSTPSFLSFGGKCRGKNYFTDANGKVSFDFTTEEDRSYSLSFDPEGENWRNLKYMSQRTFRLKEGKKNKIKYKLTPTSKLGIHFSHTPSSEFNAFGYNIEREAIRFAPYKTYQGELFRDLEKKIDTIIYYTVMQDEEYRIEGSFFDENRKTLERMNRELKIPKQTDTVYFDFKF